ncbi:hypothetical protein F5B18DRAFT_615938 [Nemania serpens]|nr:hypothetical protein F5B18DRAFT_615938 [Nemania serpens]
MDDAARDRLDYAFFDDEGISLKFPDETKIDPPKERMNEIVGLKSLLEFQLSSAMKLWRTVGITGIGEFDTPVEPVSNVSSPRREAPKLAPEWSPNRRRDKPYAPDVKMNDVLDVHNPLFDLWQAMRNL